MRYRYILGGSMATDMINAYRLDSHCQLNGFHIAVRVEIPDDMKLEHWSCDSYSTTDACVPICNLNPVIVCRMNGRWQVNDEFTGMYRHDGISSWDIDGMLSKKGYTYTDKFGYINKKQKAVYDANRKCIWQLERVPANTQNIVWKTAADYPDVIEFLRNIIKENDKLNYFNEITDDELLNIYANICVENSKPVKPRTSECSLNFLKHRLEGIANEKMFWRNAMAKLENERTE